MRLACGRYSHKPAGYWEAFGYGIFGIYKSDWDNMGGKFRTTVFLMCLHDKISR